MLFLIVDLTTALLFAHLFFPRVKVLVGVALGLAVIIASLTIGPGLNLYLQEAWSPKPASTADEPLLVSADVVTQEYQKLVEFHLQVSPTVAPGKYPTDSQICAEAERVLAEMLVAHPLTDGFHSIVYFWSHPWFETDRHLWYPSGNASTNNQGVWECEFVYPDEADS